jgi:hypothetical protein
VPLTPVGKLGYSTTFFRVATSAFDSLALTELNPFRISRNGPIVHQNSVITDEIAFHKRVKKQLIFL